MSYHKIVVEQQSSVGFLGLLTILFIAMKMLGVIAWSWFWIFFPILLPFIIGIGLLFLIGIGAMIMSVIRHRREEKARIRRRRDAGCPY